MTPSPKSKFLAEKELVNHHLDTIGSSSFQRACELAMLKFIEDAPKDGDTVSAVSNYNRIIGAREFLKTLTGLGDVPEPVKPAEIPHLNHQRR